MHNLVPQAMKPRKRLVDKASDLVYMHLQKQLMTELNQKLNESMARRH